MSLKIDGYSAPDKEIALDQGVSFTYELPYGDIIIRSRMAGRDNVGFRLAMQNFEQWSARRRNLSKGKIDEEADRRFIGLLYENLVIDWSTTIKSDGKAIQSTRDNFIDLLMSDACRNVVSVFMADAGDEQNFRPLSDEEAEKNSRKPSAGTPSTATPSNGTNS